MNITTRKVISLQNWDDLVGATYGRVYSFQQQDGCKDRQQEYIEVPCEPDDYPNDTVPEIVNGDEMGVSFKAWLERDPKQPIKGQCYDYEHNLWWERNFYPNVSMVINDLHSKGLLEAGKYYINIDW